MHSQKATKLYPLDGSYWKVGYFFHASGRVEAFSTNSKTQPPKSWGTTTSCLDHVLVSTHNEPSLCVAKQKRGKTSFILCTNLACIPSEDSVPPCIRYGKQRSLCWRSTPVFTLLYVMPQGNQDIFSQRETCSNRYCHIPRNARKRNTGKDYTK